MKTEFAPLFKLGKAEKIKLIADLWDSISQDDDDPVPAHVRQELRRRKKRFEQNPGSGLTWEEVKRSITKRK